MQFKIGDKVSFLNEKRTGVIVKFLNNNMVLVMIEEGFEIPVLIKEIVKIDFTEEDIEKNLKKIESSNNEAKTISKTDFDSKTNSVSKNQIPYHKSVLNLTTQSEVLPGIYFAFAIPHEDKGLNGFVEVFLINNTTHDILYTLAYPDKGKYFYFTNGIAYSRTKTLLDTIEIAQIETWADTHVEFLFYKEDAEVTKKPFIKDVQINPLRFLKDDSYTHCSLLNTKAFLYEIYSAKEEFTIKDTLLQEENTQKFKESQLDKFLKKINPEEFPHHYVIDEGIAEIDLHIEELTDKISNKTPTQLLDIQINHFYKMLEKAIELKFKKVYFIHGVGNGRLKNFIRETLKNSYPYLTYCDAPISKYGKGATEVNIPQNYEKYRN